MPEVDWSWLADIDLLQVSVVIVALYVIARLLMRFWPWLRKVMDLTSALSQLPAFIKRTDETLAAQNVRIEQIHHEVNYNNGSSVKDSVRRAENAIGRVELGVKGLYDRADAADESDSDMHEQIAAVRQQIKDNHPSKKEEQ